ncbi:TolC family protein [Flaviaesturariibacter amylovorans]|uniref:TolC family protein n=1 Tax=Flaviaesturariibacter amylovorans TaxID=1084520 RepID=A0ABP8GCV2_9BACT
MRPFLFLLFLSMWLRASGQQVLPPDTAVARALANSRNLRAAELTVTQQQQLLRGAAELQNPQVTFEVTPYEPLLIGVQQNFSLPGVYRGRRALQSERIRGAQLQLRGAQYDLKRDVRLSYLQLQYFSERIRLLAVQDSIYGAIRESARRFFAAGQINKLEELNAVTQADKVHNEWERARADLAAELELFRFYTALRDTFVVAPLGAEVISLGGDTAQGNVQQQLLAQQVAIAQRELALQRAEQGPQFYAGPLFPTTRDAERPLGLQAGITVPVWRRQNRSRMAAAQSGIESAQALQALERERLNARYRQALASLARERRTLGYYHTTALGQAAAIIEVSRRLFAGGELNYIESLRNLIAAFDIQTGYLEAQRAYNEAVIEVNYLNGSL